MGLGKCLGCRDSAGARVEGLKGVASTKAKKSEEKVSGRILMGLENLPDTNGTAECLPRTCADMPPSSGARDFASSTICGQVAASVTVSPCHSGGSAIPS